MQAHADVVDHGRAHGRSSVSGRGFAVALAVLAFACATPGEHAPGVEERAGRGEGGTPARPIGADAGRRDAEAAQTREHLLRLDATLAEVNRKVEQLEAAVRAQGRPPAEAAARESDLADALKQVRAALGEQGQRLDAVERSLAQARRSGGDRVASQGRTAPPERPARRDAPEASRAGAPAQDRASTLALAREQERSGQRAVARELYEQYATEFPDDPSTAEAHARLGELALGDKRYRDAILEFGKVASEFPRSEQAPDALLRTAEAMLKLDLKDDAAAVLGQIPQRYPGTPAAAQARKQLARLPAGAAGATKRE